MSGIGPEPFTYKKILEKLHGKDGFPRAKSNLTSIVVGEWTCQPR